MRIEYSKRAITDLENIDRYYRDSAGATIAAAIETRIRDVVAAYCGTRGSRFGSAIESGALILDRAASAFLT
jgi:plasmid stabilization system protein ParE